MNHDMALVAAVLDEKAGYRKALKAGAKPELLGAQAGLYWDVLSHYVDEHGQIPSVGFFKGLCPEYEHHPTGDSVEMLVEELKTYHLGNEMNIVLGQLAEKNGLDPWEAKRELVALSDKLNVMHQPRNTRSAVGEGRAKLIQNLKMLRDGSGMLGLHWPFAPLNARTPGILAGNVIYFYGRHKSKKTWVMLHMALFFESMGYRVLFFTREMSKEELEWRLGALILGIDLDDYSKGRVTDEQLEIVEEILGEIFDRGRFVITENTDGIAGYRAEIDDFQPDIVMHDYWKALADDAMGDKVTAEKRFVDRTIDLIVDYHARCKIPVIICGHANRDGEKSKGKSSSEHAWSDHIARRIHAAIRVIKSQDGERVGLRINAGRSIPEDIDITLEGGAAGFGEILNVDPSWMFATDEAQKASTESRKRQDDDANSPVVKRPIGRAFGAKPTAQRVVHRRGQTSPQRKKDKPPTP